MRPILQGLMCASAVGCGLSAQITRVRCLDKPNIFLPVLEEVSRSDGGVFKVVPMVKVIVLEGGVNCNNHLYYTK